MRMPINFFKKIKSFDLILVDLPDPNDENLNKLYTNIFYRLWKQSEGFRSDCGPVYQSLLCYGGLLVYKKTLEEEGFKVYPYHLEVPSWGLGLIGF